QVELDALVAAGQNASGTAAALSCVFWRTDSKVWDPTGCTPFEADAEAGTLTCVCNHLTDFSVLLTAGSDEGTTDSRGGGDGGLDKTTLILAIALPVAAACVCVAIVVVALAVLTGMLVWKKTHSGRVTLGTATSEYL